MKIASLSLLAAILPSAAWAQLEAEGRLRASRALEDDAMSVDSSDFSMMELAANKDYGSKSSKSAKATKTCGVDEGDQCVPSLVVRNSVTLRSCLEEAFDATKRVTIVEYLGKAPDKEVVKLTFPEKDYGDYIDARFSAGHGVPRFPAGILYAEDEEEVVDAVKCAREAGYKISPRGRGHSYQGLSSMDGYLVIDMSLMCNPSEFVVSTDVKGQSWILGEDQKLLGSIKSGSGCTNAGMLSYVATHPEFQGEKGGIFPIGSCPSVGITGAFMDLLPSEKNIPLTTKCTLIQTCIAGYATGGGQVRFVSMLSIFF